MNDLYDDMLRKKGLQRREEQRNSTAIDKENKRRKQIGEVYRLVGNENLLYVLEVFMPNVPISTVLAGMRGELLK